jgi:photosystem II stability/assembly factor-like uncharacterized protein
MRPTTLIFLILSICLAAAPAGAANVWTSIGPEGGQILSLTADPRQAGVLYAGTGQGVFKSTDGGTTWLRSSLGLTRRSIYALAVAPSDSSVVYAAGEGFFVSSDAGASWSGPSRGISDLAFITSIAVDPRDPRRVWIGTNNSLFRSEDAGATWYSLYADLIARVVDVAVDPFQRDTVYAVISAMEDYGATGVVKSTNGGATWKLLKGGLDPDFYQDYAQLAVDPTTPGLLYVSFHSLWPEAPVNVVTWRSTDGGAKWRRTQGGYPIAVDRKGVVYAGDMRSTDHGQTWQKAAAPPDFALRYAADSKGTLWAGTYRQGVFRSRDQGSRWEPAKQGLHAATVTSFAIDPEQPRVIYAGAGSAGVYKRLSSGAAWRRVDSDLPGIADGFTTRQQPQTVYLAWDVGGFARSDDGGAHWTVLWKADDFTYQFLVSEILVDPTSSDVVFLRGEGVVPEGPCGLARSDDRGATFQCVPEEGVVVPDPAKPGTLWRMTARHDRLWKSTDHGAHWTAVRLRGLEQAGDLRSLAIDPIHAGRMFLGTGRSANVHRPELVWRSETDGDGLSWQPWGRGFPELSKVTQLLVDAQKPSILYAAVEHFYDYLHPEDNASGVYWSRDGGKTFRPAGITGRVLQLTQDPKNPRKLYASIEGRGIYTWTRP